MPRPLVAFSNSDCRLPPDLSNLCRKNELGSTAALEQERAIAVLDLEHHHLCSDRWPLLALSSLQIQP
ncbi:hypothetical protein E2562_030005 [Oryza meyeriana var. granulata]|uniref:Uncharacterized protein n=1 Tax=Oryza meyeriana var. granulata TaxID=110450 RepID=A0A6G1FE45_9ORYZ|nr:hypothetical protein E2562_030005 [Oryza meyeriana var. granulata]